MLYTQIFAQRHRAKKTFYSLARLRASSFSVKDSNFKCRLTNVNAFLLLCHICFWYSWFYLLNACVWVFTVQPFMVLIGAHLAGEVKYPIRSRIQCAITYWCMPMYPPSTDFRQQLFGLATLEGHCRHGIKLRQRTFAFIYLQLMNNNFIAFDFRVYEHVFHLHILN